MQQDYILREIEKIGMLLIGLREKMKKAIQDSRQSEDLAISNLNEELINSVGFDLDLLTKAPENDFDEILRNHAGFDDTNIEILADLMNISAELIYKGPERLRYYLKAIEIYEYLDDNTKTFSIDRNQKINELKEKIKRESD